MRTNPFSTQSKVRAALKTADRPLRIPAIRDLIGLSGQDGYDRVNRAMTDLRKARQAERVDRGLWIYAGDRPDSAYCAVQRRMQRIMWKLSKRGEAFTARGIAELSDATIWYAQQYVAFLIREGVIRKRGQTMMKTAATPLYIGEDHYLTSDDWPVMRSQSRTREMDACLLEMRELAQRFFSVENLTSQTILNLKDAASRLGFLVGECEKMKRNMRQNTNEGE